jgi:hypothetical protein
MVCNGKGTLGDKYGIRSTQLGIGQWHEPG